MSLALLETPKTGFLATRPILFRIGCLLWYLESSTASNICVDMLTLHCTGIILWVSDLHLHLFSMLGLPSLRCKFDFIIYIVLSELAEEISNVHCLDVIGIHFAMLLKKCNT